MIKPRLYILIVILGILSLLVGACAQPAPTPIPTPPPAPTPVPTPPPAPVPTPRPAPPLSGTVEVYVTDAPPRDEVTSILVTATKLEIHKAVTEREMEQELEQSGSDNQTQEQKRGQQQTEQGAGEWMSIDIADNITTFDLLKIRGIEEFFATSEVGAGKYTQIRLTIDKVEVALGDEEPQEATVPSKELKFVRPFDVVAGETTIILLDFDADKSVTVTGAGKIIVKPVVKLTFRQGKSTSQKGREDVQPTKTTEQTSIEVSCADFMESQHISQQVDVAAGDSFSVTLCSNPSTGFQWEQAQISDPTVLQEVDHKSIGPPEETGDMPPAPGTPGQEVWTFQALKAGESTVSIDYSRPWEGGEKGTWTFNLTVVVK